MSDYYFYVFTLTCMSRLIFKTTIIFGFVFLLITVRQNVCLIFTLFAPLRPPPPSALFSLIFISLWLTWMLEWMYLIPWRGSLCFGHLAIQLYFTYKPQVLNENRQMACLELTTWRSIGFMYKPNVLNHGHKPKPFALSFLGFSFIVERIGKY